MNIIKHRNSRTSVVDEVGPTDVVEDWNVVVMGSVRGTVKAYGGGAKVVVLGDVHPEANIHAQGGAAAVVVMGRVQ